MRLDNVLRIFDCPPYKLGFQLLHIVEMEKLVTL